MQKRNKMFLSVIFTITIITVGSLLAFPRIITNSRMETLYKIEEFKFDELWKESANQFKKLPGALVFGDVNVAEEAFHCFVEWQRGLSTGTTAQSILDYYNITIYYDATKRVWFVYADPKGLGTGAGLLINQDNGLAVWYMGVGK